MSERRMPPKSDYDPLDDLALQEKADGAHADYVRDQWASGGVIERVKDIPAPSFDDDDPKIGGAAKTQKGWENIPESEVPARNQATGKLRLDVYALWQERDRLITESIRLMALGADPVELEPIQGVSEDMWREALAKYLNPLMSVEAGNHGVTGNKPANVTGNEGSARHAFRSPDKPFLPSVDAFIHPLPDPLESIKVPKVPPLPNEPHGAPSIPEVTMPEVAAEDMPSFVKADPGNDKSVYVWDGKSRGKDSNPKDAIGSRKAGLSMLPRQVMYEVGLAMLEGALKYARHNYRIAGVRASVYYDANSRHLDAWWEGQDTDPGSGLHHISKAIASLVVLRDSMLAGNWYDDRPPSIGNPNWLDAMNKEAERIIDAFEGEPKKPYIKGDNV